MLTDRRSIEALRAGVPNRSAVRQLGTDQKAIETRFIESLSQVAAERSAGRQVQGFVIQGEFGAGKSHLLEWLQHVALEQKFACSKVVVSKEAPLGDVHRVFRAAMESLRLPDRVGGLPEVVERLRFDSQAYADLHRRVQEPGGGFDPLLQASLVVHERLRHQSDFVDRIVSFWGGDRLHVGDLKKHLRQVGEARPDVRSRRIRDLAVPRLRFVAELIAAAGYTGWVLLLDEVELVASMSLTARARAYAALACLAGRLPRRPVPGLVTVGCVTAEFTGVVFEQRRDREKIQQRWSEDPGALAEMEAGMAFLAPTSRSWARVRPPDASALQRTHDRVREIYMAAYPGWAVPEAEVVCAGPPRSMRQHVREWLTRWDLLRLYPDYEPAIERETVEVDLSERDGLEAESEPRGEHDEEAGQL